jgi:CubicO group peptidase (beta-lactamase class C family)
MKTSAKRRPDRTLFSTVGVISFIASCAVVTANTPNRKLDEYLTRRANNTNFTGVVLVAKSGEIVLRKGYGMADFELNVPNTPDKIFRIASLTKPFTATAVLLLYEREQLDLMDPIGRYISTCPPSWKAVRVHHLLNHTSGIPDAFTQLNDAAVKETAAELERVLSEINSSPGDWTLRTPPGESYAYSNFNYILLGYIIEKVSGEYWEDFLIQNLFRPLNMKDTRYDDVWAIVEGRVRGYTSRKGMLRKGSYDDHSAYAAGGLISTVDDLAKFVKAYFSGELLTEATLKRALQAHQDNYGYGWQVIEFFGRRVYNHTGGIGGFAAHMAFYPDEEIVIIVLSNNQRERVHGTACDLAAFLFGEDHLFLDTDTIQLPDEALLPYVGAYLRASDEAQIQVYLQDATLVFQRGDMQREYLPVAQGMFVEKGRPDYSLLFSKSANGEVESFEWRRCGRMLLSATRKGR